MGVAAVFAAATLCVVAQFSGAFSLCLLLLPCADVLQAWCEIRHCRAELVHVMANMLVLVLEHAYWRADRFG